MNPLTGLSIAGVLVIALTVIAGCSSYRHGLEKTKTALTQLERAVFQYAIVQDKNENFENVGPSH